MGESVNEWQNPLTFRSLTKSEKKLTFENKIKMDGFINNSNLHPFLLLLKLHETWKKIFNVF